MTQPFALLAVAAVACLLFAASANAQCTTLSCANPQPTFSTSPGYCRAFTINPPLPTNSGCTTLSNNISNSISSYSYNLGTTNVLWSGYIGNTITSTTVCNVVVEDGQAPTFSATCPSLYPTYAPSTFAASTGLCYFQTSSGFNSSATDNCLGQITYAYSLGFSGTVNSMSTVTGSGQTVTYNFPVGTTSIQQTAQDSSLNQATCSFALKVFDTQPPTLSCSAVSFGSDVGTCGARVTIAPTSFTDNCQTQSLSPTPAAAFHSVGTGSVAFTASDFFGNTASCTVSYQVHDTQPPTVSCTTSSITIQSTCGDVPTLSGGTASDNCALSSATFSKIPGVYPQGNTSAKYVATDTAGNSANCQVPIFVNITSFPTFTSCPNVSISVNAASGACSAVATYSVGFSPSTACGGSHTLSASVFPSITGGIATNSGTFKVGANVLTIIGSQTYSNNNTLKATCSFVVFVNDSSTPTVSCVPTSSTLSPNCAFVATYSVTFGNTCGDYLFAQSSGFTLGAFGSVSPTSSIPTYTLTGLFSVTNPFNNVSATCSAVTTYTDTSAPLPSCPVGNYLAILGSTCSVNAATVVSSNPPSAIDNCTPQASLTPSYTPSLGALTGTLRQSYTAKFTDPSGNSASCPFSITSVDRTAPAFSCPSGQSVILSSTTCTGSVPSYTVTATDNCGPTGLILSYSGFTTGTTVSQPGTYDLTATATDASGNSNSNCVIATKFIDNTNPVFVNCSSAAAQICPGNTITFPIATDNCGTVAVTVTSSNSTSTTYLATDGSGNNATCTQNIAVLDNTPPQITCLSSYSVTLQPNLWTAFILPTSLYTAVSDNCAFVSVVNSSKTTFNYLDAFLSPETVTVYAYDPSGNVGTCTVDLTINARPVLVLPGNGAIVRQGTPFTISWENIPSLPSGATISFGFAFTGTIGSYSHGPVSYSALSTTASIPVPAKPTSKLTITATINANVNGVSKTHNGGSQTVQYRAKL